MRRSGNRCTISGASSSVELLAFLLLEEIRSVLLRCEGFAVFVVEGQGKVWMDGALGAGTGAGCAGVGELDSILRSEGALVAASGAALGWGLAFAFDAVVGPDDVVG